MRRLARAIGGGLRYALLASSLIITAALAWVTWNNRSGLTVTAFQPMCGILSAASRTWKRLHIPGIKSSPGVSPSSE